MADKDDLSAYFRYKPKEANAASLIVLGAIMVAGAAAFYAGSSYAGIGLLAVLPFAWSLYRQYVVWHIGLTDVELSFSADKLTLTEHYGRPAMLRSRNVEMREARTIKSMTWTSHGAHIEIKGQIGGRGSVLPLGLLESQEAIDALARWAEAHGIKIEGVPPLPGGYVRSVEGV